MAFDLVRYSQQNPLWKGNKIANGPDTIGRVGCALTCAAMYSSGWGFNETPATLNQKLKANGGYVGEAIVWNALNKIYPQIKSTGLTICTNTDAPLVPINLSLASGQPVIIQVDFSLAAGLQTHWVLLYAQQGNDYLVLDPWPYPSDTQNVTLMQRFSQGKQLQRTIKAVAWYQCSAGTPAPAPDPVPAPTAPPVSTDLVIQVIATATAGVKLHTQASLSSSANYAEMPGVPLNVIENKVGALAKLGQNNQWIYVQDPQGHQGYVAAWYVEQVSTDTPTPDPTPSPAPSTPPASDSQRIQVVVLNNVGKAGLAVRQQPSPGATKVNIEKAGTRLTVIEPADTATPKIGVTGQWIAVKATNNQRGYVMAQYVKLKQ